MSPHPWIQEVHASMLKSGVRLNSWQIAELFGQPEGAQNACNRLHVAMMRGWFDVTKDIDGRYVYQAKVRVTKRAIWTQEQHDLLRKVWPEMGIKCAHLFPESTPRGVRSMAEKLKIHRLKRGRPPKPKENAPKPEIVLAPLPSRDGLPRVTSIFNLATALEAA